MAKKKSQNGMMERASFQQNEAYPSQNTGLPNDRFQGEAQTATADQTKTVAQEFLPDGNKAPESSSIVARAATVVKKKMSVKPTSDTAIEDGKIIGGVPLGEAGAAYSVAGAQGSVITSDQSRVPYSSGDARPAGRYGKKISTDNFVINNVVCEQIKPSFDEPKDLRESPDSVQGYNGRKQFNTARGKKTYGYHPTSTLFERSVDFLEHGNVIHTTGQVIGDVPPTSNYPTTVTTGDSAQYDVIAEKGNYLINGLSITISEGHITALEFDENRIIVPDAAEASEQANMNWQVDANNVAKAMVKMQTELGRETTDKWSPLGYVIKQPYQFGMLFHDGEAICGALTGAAYKSAAHSLAFLQNKMAKEGVRNLPSIAEWMGENFVRAAKGTMYDGFGNTEIFSREFMKQGAASAIIDMFDSTAKYTTKADFLNQPRSLKFHLQTVDNNINPFHAKKQFYKALDQCMYFSTDDGQYNPVLPIHVTGEIKVMTPYSLNVWLEHWSNPHLNTRPTKAGTHGQFYSETGVLDGVTYSYEDIRNKYDWEYTDPFIAGLCRWLLRHESKIVSTYGDGKVYLPLNLGNTTANTLSFMICSAAQDIAWMRNIIFRDYLFAGDQGVYVWEDLTSLKELNPLYSSQYTYSDYGSALKLGKLSAVSQIRLNWPEVITCREDIFIEEKGGDGDPAQPVKNRGYYLPFYFNENAIDANSSVGISVDRGCVMSFPIIRNGVNHEAVDSIYSMSERDVRLCLDRMVTLPVHVTIDSGVIEGDFDHLSHYEYNALRYDTNSDGRVVMVLKDKDRATNCLMEATYLATPRELGYIFPLAMNVARPIAIDSLKAPLEHPINAYLCGATADAAVSYYSLGGNGSGSIDRAVSLSQTWIKCFATPLARPANLAYVRATGITLSLGSMFDVDWVAIKTSSSPDTYIAEPVFTLINNELCTIPAMYHIQSGTIIKHTTNVDEDGQDHSVPNNAYAQFSLAKAMWCMVQRRCTPINVFDSSFMNQSGCTVADYYDGVICDPLEFASYFGFAGTLASDFNQDVLDRLDKKDQLGMFYYEDEFIKSSLIFR